MAKHNEIGKVGETLARQYLEQNGYLILETNWRVGKLEADIIAYKDNLVVFVEVKTRTSEEFGEPEEFVRNKKITSYIRLANAYIIKHNRTEEVRFDIISIVLKGQEPQIRHLVNAYSTIG